MSSSRARRLGAVLMLAWAIAYAAIASPPLASSLLIALHGADHPHALAVAPGDGHVHVVLSHDGAEHPRGGERGVSEADHVLDLFDSDEATPRKVPLDPSPPLLTAPAAAPTRAIRVAALPTPELRARSADLLRSVVLLL